MTDPKPATPWGLKWRHWTASPVDGWQYGTKGFATDSDAVNPVCETRNREHPYLIHAPHYFGDDKP